METVKRLLVAYEFAVVLFSVLTAVALGTPAIVLSARSIPDALFLYALMMLGMLVGVTAALVPVSPLVLWAALQSARAKILVVALMPAYAVLVAFAGDAIGIQEFRWHNVPGLAVVLFAVVSLFFLIEHGLRRGSKRGEG